MWGEDVVEGFLPAVWWEQGGVATCPRQIWCTVDFLLAVS